MILVVEGIPGPQGSKSFKGMRTSKTSGKTHAVMVESSKKVKPWRTAVKAEAERLLLIHPGGKVLGPVSLEIVFYFAPPKSAPRRRRIHQSVRPDLSKLIRSTEDALTDAGAWEDDSRVVHVEAESRYSYPEDHPMHDPKLDLIPAGAIITIMPTVIDP